MAQNRVCLAMFNSAADVISVKFVLDVVVVTSWNNPID